MKSNLLRTGACVAVLAAPLAGAPRIPPPAPASTAIACHADEPGPRLLLIGLVLDPSGRPVAGATVTAYNTDVSGLYNPRGGDTRGPRIRATVQTDDAGRFQILTVRPAPYPEGNDPAHVHFETVSPSYHVDFTTIWFEGDPLITPERRQAAREYERSHPRDAAVVRPVERRPDGLQAVRVTIRLEPN